MPFLVPGHMQLCIRPRPLEIHQWQAQGTYLFAKNSKKKQQQLFHWKNTY